MASLTPGGNFLELLCRGFVSLVMASQLLFWKLKVRSIRHHQTNKHPSIDPNIENLKMNNILDTKTKVETYWETTLSFRISETFDDFHTRITTRMVVPAKFSDCHSSGFKRDLILVWIWKADRHDINEILLKVALNTITLTIILNN